MMKLTVQLSRFAFILPLLLLALPAVGDDTAVDLEKQVKTWERTIDKAEKRIDSGRTGSLEERDLRTSIKAIADKAAILRERATKQARQSKALLEALGPQPEENAGPEAAPIQKQRKSLEQEITAHEGRAKQAGLIIAKADLALAKISSRSRERLKDVLFERTGTPLNQNAWTIAFPEALKLFKASFVLTPQSWWSKIQQDAAHLQALLQNLAISITSALVGWGLGVWLRKRYGRTEVKEQPSHSRRLLAGLVEGGSRSLAPIILVSVFAALLFEQELVDETITPLLEALARNLVLFFLGYGLINAGLTLRRQEWRLLDFGPEASQLLSFRLKLVLLVFLVLDGLGRATAWAAPSTELASISAFIFTLTVVPLLIWLMDTRIWGTWPVIEESGTPPTPSMVLRLRPIISLGLGLLPVVAIIGYPVLAVYLVRALIMSALVLATLGLLRSVARESLALSFDAQGAVGRFTRNLFNLHPESTRRAVFWLNALMDLALITIAILTILPLWGFGAEESAITFAKIMRGIQIGSYTLSLADIALGLILFSVIIFVTRLLQNGLERHVLPNLSKDRGIQVALKTGVGYVGTVIALLVTVAALGLDLTNLALIAGALSVGLGFGLQNVVNNFVSGLILLAERPIKPGDWVIVGGHEGKVKKVNVRSTEIETFQRASVIIPNADLISTPVVNWTHKNILGRVEVAVGVAYGTDPRLVERILLGCAKAHPNVISYPEANVLFTDFADSSLNFELRAYLSDVEQRLSTGSELRFAINDAFAENGVEIPFPQRVVHMVASTDTPQTADTPDAESTGTPDDKG